MSSETRSPSRVSVVIAVRNDADGLRLTLDALRRQTMSRDEMEIVVVDDASTDGTAEVVARTDEQVQLIRQSAPAGAYVARNRAIRASSGRWIAVTDAGCVPASTWLERGVGQLQRDPATVIGGHIAMPLGPRPSVAAMVDVVHHLDQRRCIESHGYAVTANLMASREAFEDTVGLFDEGLSSSGDVEWTRRARAAGMRLVYAPDVVVSHAPRARAGQLLAKSRRVARGGSALRSQGAPKARRRAYFEKDLLIPRHRRDGRARIKANGADPGPVRWLAVGVGQVAWVQVPQALAALAADLRASHKTGS